MAEHTLPVFPLPAIPQVVHEAVRREIARMNTAICQATQNSPIKVSLTWRPNPQFALQLSEQVLNCIDGDAWVAAPAAFSVPVDAANIDKSITDLERSVAGITRRLEEALAAFKAAAAQI
jgi:hypothetical protein